MRVVVDTNVFVSSFYGGWPRKVLDLWRTGQITLCLCPGIIDEYVAALGRMGLADKRELSELLALFRGGTQCLFAANPPDLRIVEADPDDDKFIACAVALDADIVVSGDKHLLDVGRYLDIEILRPRDFVERFD